MPPDFRSGAGENLQRLDVCNKQLILYFRMLNIHFLQK